MSKKIKISPETFRQMLFDIAVYISEDGYESFIGWMIKRGKAKRLKIKRK